MTYHQKIKQNAIEINRLKQSIQQSHNVKNKHDEWAENCREYNEKYFGLCFWNGLWDYRKEIRSGNLEAIEYYICFIEVRPYFFRSGYMYNDLMRVFKNIELTTDHRRRFNIIRTKFLQFKENQKQR